MENKHNASQDFLSVREAVFKKSTTQLENSLKVHGYEFDNGIVWEKIMNSFLYTGFQATNLGLALNEIKKMIHVRSFENVTSNQPSDITLPTNNDYITENFASDYCTCNCKPPSVKRNCVIFLSYTSNLVSCGVREIIKYLVKHHLVDVLVTTAGGIEEDLIKCMASTYLGDFNLDGKNLRSQGLNRIGNLIIPNENYCKFEDWILPVFDKMLLEQNEKKINWTPSKMISRLGHEINDPSSIYYWAHHNNIPVFCPALTDGSIGDMLYFHSYKNPGLKLDIIEDVKRINNIAIRGAPKTGVLILGGGLVKHHALNANMMRNGADFSVYINSFQEFDGSDAGASPSEALSWGKVKSSDDSTVSNGHVTGIEYPTVGDQHVDQLELDANSITRQLALKYKGQSGMPVKVFADASLIFPFIVASTFAKHFEEKKNSNLN